MFPKGITLSKWLSTHYVHTFYNLNTNQLFFSHDYRLEFPKIPIHTTTLQEVEKAHERGWKGPLIRLEEKAIIMSITII
jgi:hypothetical protein